MEVINKKERPKGKSGAVNEEIPEEQANEDNGDDA